MLNILRCIFGGKEATHAPAGRQHVMEQGIAPLPVTYPPVPAAREPAHRPAPRPQMSTFVYRDQVLDRNGRITGYEFSFDREMQSKFKDRSAAIRKVYDDALMRELATSLVGEVLTDQLAVVDVALASIAKGKSDELPRANTVLILDPMQELPAHESVAGTINPDLAFLTGLLSLLDQFLGRPMADVLLQISVPAEVKDALLTQSGPYAPLFELAKSCEQGEQVRIAAAAAKCGLGEDAVNAQLIAALNWAHGVAAITD